MKKIILLSSICLVLPFVLFGCNSSSENLSTYTLNCQYNDDNHSLTCSQDVNYVNSSDNALDEIKFFLYANAFAEGHNPVPTAEMSRAYPNGESYGNIEINDVKVESVNAEFSVNEQGNILTVNLSETLYPDESVNIGLDYVVNLANINHRLGYGENTVNFGNFFPIVCVYENGFVENSFSASGDPFYSDVANFDVTITYDESFSIATTGTIVSETTSDGNKTTVVEADKVRDFCFVLSKKFNVIESVVDDITVKYFYYDDENAQDNLELSCKVMETFSEMFGKYPYQQISVVKSNFCFGGMEYPNLVLISDNVADEETYRYVIVHELAHQWWYSLVGNNEYEEAWLDESLTEYSTALFFEAHEEYGLNYNDIISGAETTYRTFLDVYESVLGEVDESMNRNLSEFATEPEYVNNIYTKGVLLYDNLRETLGDSKFMKCLKSYFKDYCYKNASSSDLISTFSKTSRVNLEGYFNSWLNGEVVFNK